MAVYEHTVVIGAAKYDSDGAGFASVFVQTGNNWTHEVKLLAPDGSAGDWFGQSVVLDEDTIVVGSFQSVHIFVRSEGEWTHHAKLLPPDGSAGDGFGVSVALYLDTIIMGAPYDDDNGSDS